MVDKKLHELFIPTYTVQNQTLGYFILWFIFFNQKFELSF